MNNIIINVIAKYNAYSKYRLKSELESKILKEMSFLCTKRWTFFLEYSPVMMQKWWIFSIIHNLFHLNNTSRPSIYLTFHSEIRKSFQALTSTSAEERTHSRLPFNIYYFCYYTRAFNFLSVDMYCNKIQKCNLLTGYSTNINSVWMCWECDCGTPEGREALDCEMGSH